MAKFSVEGGEEGPSSPKKRRRDAEHPLDRGHGHDSDNEKAISVTIDPDVLDCSICLEPLLPPVFQCDNGHTACAGCCSKLKNKCHTCSWPIGYSRCLAIEKVIESIKVRCQYSCYGCRETLSYSQKAAHEEACFYIPCCCPISDCKFLGPSEQLSGHVLSDHQSAVTQFVYNKNFQVSLDKNDAFHVLLGEDGLLFVINNGRQHLGQVVSLTSIGSPAMVGRAFRLRTGSGGRSLCLQSFTKNARKLAEIASNADFLMVPNSFNSCLQVKLELCIWSNGKLE